MTDLFIQPLYMLFLPFFILGLLVTLPFALSRGRIILKIALGIAVVFTLALLLFSLTVPYAGLVYFYIMYWLGPAMMAGAIALLLTSKRMKTHKVQHTIFSALIVGGPFLLGQAMSKSSETIAERKAQEQEQNEPVLRKQIVPVGLGPHRLYIPLGSTRISVNPEGAETLSMRKYEDAKSLAKIAKRTKKPVKLKAVYLSGYKLKTCEQENFKNPTFWCDFEPTHKHYAFNVMWGGKSTRPTYKTEAKQEPDERGLIALQTHSKRTRQFLLPLATTEDAVGHPIRLSCSLPYSKGTRMECSTSFAISKTIKVSVMQVRGDEKEMADIALYILEQLQKQP